MTGRSEAARQSVLRHFKADPLLAMPSIVDQALVNTALLRDEQIPVIGKVLNSCLLLLDEMGMWQASAHLAAAIDSLPGQTSVPPLDAQNMMSE